jgi:hypothetical protein
MGPQLPDRRELQVLIRRRLFRDIKARCASSGLFRARCACRRTIGRCEPSPRSSVGATSVAIGPSTRSPLATEVAPTKSTIACTAPNSCPTCRQQAFHAWGAGCGECLGLDTAISNDKMRQTEQQPAPPPCPRRSDFSRDGAFHAISWSRLKSLLRRACHPCTPRIPNDARQKGRRSRSALLHSVVYRTGQPRRAQYTACAGNTSSPPSAWPATGPGTSSACHRPAGSA